MRPGIRAVFSFAAIVAAIQAVAFGGPLPPLTGGLAGELIPTLLRDAPAIKWQMDVQQPDAKTHRVLLTATGEGFRARAEVQLDDTTKEGTWRLTESLIDLPRWYAITKQKLGGTAAELTATGELSLSGEGTLRAGKPSGTVHVEWRKGGLKHEAGGWQLDGIELDAELAFDAASHELRGTRAATLTISTIATSRFGARNLVVSAILKDLGTLLLESARIEIAGGEVTVAPATIPLHPADVNLELQLMRVGLQDVAALVPSAVSDAKGRIDGNVRVRWSEAHGFDLGAGKLVLRRDEPAHVRLAPAPGLITSNLPKFILWFYPGLKKVENGELPIEADVLDVTLTPQGDSEGRTAVVHLAGGPTDPKNRAPVDLTVNVRAPLKTLIDFGTSGQLHFKW